MLHRNWHSQNRVVSLENLDLFLFELCIDFHVSGLNI